MMTIYRFNEGNHSKVERNEQVHQSEGKRNVAGVDILEIHGKGCSLWRETGINRKVVQHLGEFH